MGERWEENPGPQACQKGEGTCAHFLLPVLSPALLFESIIKNNAMELLGSPGWSWLDFWEHASKEDWAAHHPVLSLDEEQRCKAVAVTLHGDEGESKRSKNVLILSWSSIGIHGPSLKTKFPFCVSWRDIAPLIQMFCLNFPHDGS